MEYTVSGKCPVCSGEMKVKELGCSTCGSSLHGKFQLCRFCRLSQEQQAFLEVFVKNRGNIKEIEKELGISYPTVKNRLEDAISAMGFEPTVKSVVNRKEVLQQLSDGLISKSEALKILSE